MILSRTIGLCALAYHRPMPPIHVAFIVIGTALLLTGISLAVKYRRDGGVEIYSRKWYVTVILASAGAALATVPAVHVWVLPALGFS